MRALGEHRHRVEIMWAESIITVSIKTPTNATRIITEIDLILLGMEIIREKVLYK